MENKMEIGKAIKKKIEGLDQNPSDQLWGKIEKELNAKSRNKFLFWVFPLVVFIGFTTFCGYNFLTDQKINFYNKIDNEQLNKKNNPSSRNKLDPNSISSKSFKVLDSSQKIINGDQKTKNNEDISKHSSLKNIDKQIDSIIKPIKTLNKNLYNKTTRLVRSNSKYDEYEVTLKRKYFYRKYKNKTKYSTVSVSKHRTKKNNAYKNYKQPRIFTKVEAELLPETENLTLKNNTLNDAVTINNLDNKSDIEIPQSATTTTMQKKDIKIKPKKNILADTTQIKKPQDSKFEIVLSPYFGPSYYDSFANGNLITARDATAKKKGLLTYNYGVYFRWMATERFGLRLGFGKTDYNYSVSTVNNNDFIDFNTVNVINYTETQIYNDFSTAPKVNFTQKTSYVEVPIEAYFVIKDYKKFEIAATTGLSLLFLRDNNLTLKSDAIQERVIGTNKKTLEFGYTVNAGLSFGYKLTKKLNFDISPSFKLQFIEVIRNENFQPFSANLQAGFSYKW